MLREAERAAKLDKEMTSNNNKYIPVLYYTWLYRVYSCSMPNQGSSLAHLLDKHN